MASNSLCPFPDYNLLPLARTLEMLTNANGSLDLNESIGPLLARTYPFLFTTIKSAFPLEHQQALETLIDKLGIQVYTNASLDGSIQNVSLAPQADMSPAIQVQMRFGDSRIVFSAPGGRDPHCAPCLHVTLACWL